MVDRLAPNPTLPPASVAPPSTGSRLAASIRELVPAEGPAVVLLHLIMLLAAAWSVLDAGWVEDLQAIPVIVLAGSVIGLLLAKAEAPDLASHLVAFWLGLLIVITHTIVQFPDLGDNYAERARELATLFEEWTRSTASGERMDDRHLFVALMGLTGWLVAYMSAWTLYRRSWVTASVLLPGAVMMINLGYRPESGAAPLVLYIVAAGSLVVAHFARRRRWDWQARGIQAPAFISSRILGIGFNVVLVLTVLGWILPISIRDDLLRSTWQLLDRPVEAAQGQIDDWLGDLTGDGRNRGESYASFDDSFDLGGALDLSDDPMLEFSPDADTAPYLAAQRMDDYDGHGWRSTADQTFEQAASDVGATYSSRIAFDPDLPVVLSDDVTTDRQRTGGTVRVLSPSDRTMFTRDTYSSSDISTSVQLSWVQMDGTRLAIRTAGERAALPPDLRRLAGLLSQASFDQDGEGVEADDAGLASRIAAEFGEVEGRLVQVSWTVTDGVAAALTVTGPIPVYDDINSVQAQAPLPVNAAYDIGGLETTATGDDLAAAGTDYPAYVTDRYLQLPTTVTDRTRTLARQLVADAGATNPYDIAVTIQNDLRSRIEYTESPPEPPDDRDVVDYVLFDTQAGYCEYYASAMAVMLRTLDVPARVVTGYFPPAYDDSLDGYIYREKNAHVWVEAYFPAFGWIPFEPTANRAAPSYGEDPSASPSPSPTPPPSASPSPSDAARSTIEPSPTPSPSPSPAAVAATDPNDSGSPLDGPIRWILIAAGAMLLLLVIAAILLALSWRRGLGGLSPVSALYARTVRLGGWLRIRGDPAMTPTEYAEQIGRSVPAARHSARTVAEQYTAEQYAPASVTPSYPVGRRAWDDLRRTLLRSIPRLLSPRRPR